MSVTVVVVNYHTAALTTGAVRSALAEPDVTAAVLVDNASGGDDVGILRALALVTPEVTGIESSTNLGFGAAVNRAAATATTPHLFLLNSDAVVEPGSIGNLGPFLDSDPVVGVVAPSCAAPTALQVDASDAFLRSQRHCCARIVTHATPTNLTG